METNIPKFEPHKDLHILVVDGDPLSCRLLKETLLTCNYRVTVADNAKDALKHLTKEKNRFNIAMIDVHQSGTDGIDFMEMALDMEIFIIQISATRDDMLMAEAKSHGADLFMLKPLGLETVTFLWQHLLPRNIDKKYQIRDHEVKKSNNSSSPRENCSEKEMLIKEEGVGVGVGVGGDGNNKKRRIRWNIDDVNDKFLMALHTLGGIDSKNSTPKRIHELMNAGDEVTREQISSHLQKLKEKAKKGRGTVNHQQEGNLTNQNPTDAKPLVADISVDLPNHVFSDYGNIGRTASFDLPICGNELMSFCCGGINHEPNLFRQNNQFQATDFQSNNFPVVGFQVVNPYNCSCGGLITEARTHDQNMATDQYHNYSSVSCVPFIGENLNINYGSSVPCNIPDVGFQQVNDPYCYPSVDGMAVEQLGIPEAQLQQNTAADKHGSLDGMLNILSCQ